MPKFSFGKLKLTLVISFCLLLLVLSALFLTLQHPQVLAQVTSGDVNILDIVMDSGGGARESGTGADRVILANTSIGESIGGGCVKSGDVTICTGHAAKIDYDYEKEPVVAKLEIGPDTTTGAVNTPCRGKRPGEPLPERCALSGLRSDEEGSSYSNALLIQPKPYPQDANAIKVIGAAFVLKDSVNKSTVDLTKNSFDSRGFMLMYANKPSSFGYFDKAANTNKTITLGAGKYYVYVDGRLRELPIDKDIFLPLIGIRIQVSTDYSKPPLNPAFSVTLYKALGSNTWDTYGFIVSDLSLAGSITKIDPSPISETVPARFPDVSTGSTFYLFSLF